MKKITVTSERTKKLLHFAKKTSKINTDAFLFHFLLQGIFGFVFYESIFGWGFSIRGFGKIKDWKRF
jgi:hypothetical protein